MMLDDGNNHEGITALQKGTSEHPINLASCLLLASTFAFVPVSLSSQERSLE